MLTRRVGAQEGLSSERKYTLYTLPQGVLRGVADAIRGDFSGLGRAVAIITGLLITATGYSIGLFMQQLRTWSSLRQRQITYDRV